MKKYPWIFALVILLAVGAFFRLKTASTPLVSAEPNSPLLAPPPGALPEPPSPRLQALREGPREPITVKSDPSVTPECAVLWNTVRGLDLADIFSYPPKAGQLPDADKCGTPPAALKAAHDRYVQDCKGLAQRIVPGQPPEQGMNAVAPCFLAATLYRATLTDWMTREKKLSDITDPRVLSDKLAAKVFTDPAGAAAVAERLLELEPDLYPAAKIAAVSRLLDAQNRAAGDPRSPLWNKSDDATADAAKRNPNDPSLLEMQIVSEILRSNDPQGLRNRVEGIRDRNPDLSDYLTAWIEYKGSNVESATRILREMQNRGARDPRVAETLARLQAGQKDPFQSRIQFPVDAVAPPPPGPRPRP